MQHIAVVFDIIWLTYCLERLRQTRVSVAPTLPEEPADPNVEATLQVWSSVYGEEARRRREEVAAREVNPLPAYALTLKHRNASNNRRAVRGIAGY